MKNIKVVGFDADDTLWINEPYFQETEKHFCSLLSGFLEPDAVSRELFATEMQNLELYGYGVKSFMLSMIETALRISGDRPGEPVITSVITLGKELLSRPVELLDGISEVLEKLQSKGYKILMATKGDLLDQERKLAGSGLAKYFHHIEIMSDKKESDYARLLANLEISPKDFLMVGNSLKSDILPVINLGGYGVYVPYHVTWAHEKTEMNTETERMIQIKKISEITGILDL
jgi:putative hydrolase of the HAD superfamily